MATLRGGRTDKFTVLLWGPPLSGKTVLASQFPKPYFIDLDGQLGSVRTLASQQGQDFDFSVLPIDEAETEDEDFIALCGSRMAKQHAWIKTKKAVEVLAGKLEADQTIILDNLSRAGEYLIDYVKHRSGHDQLQIQDWGIFVDEMKTLVDYLQSRFTKANSVLVGHEALNKDDASGAMIKRILIPTSMRDRLPAKASDYLYMTTDVSGSSQKRKIRRKLQSVPDTKNPTGSRSLIPDTECPTFEKLKPYLEIYIGRELPPATWSPPDEDLGDADKQ